MNSDKLSLPLSDQYHNPDQGFKPGSSSACLLEFDTRSKPLGHHGRFFVASCDKIKTLKINFLFQPKTRGQKSDPKRIQARSALSVSTRRAFEMDSSYLVLTCKPASSAQNTSKERPTRIVRCAGVKFNQSLKFLYNFFFVAIL